MSGLMALTGQLGDPPTRPGGSLSDVAASCVAFGGCADRSPRGHGKDTRISGARPLEFAVLAGMMLAATGRPAPHLR